MVSSSGIRTALLDSDQHICPTCSQSGVSPDTLIANKFLRQVNLTNTYAYTYVCKICIGGEWREGGWPEAFLCVTCHRLSTLFKKNEATLKGVVRLNPKIQPWRRALSPPPSLPPCRASLRRLTSQPIASRWATGIWILFTQKFTFSSTNSVTFCFLLHLVFALLLKDPLLHCPMAVDTPSTSEVCGSPPTEIGPVAASDVPSTSLQPVQSHQEAANK